MEKERPDEMEMAKKDYESSKEKTQKQQIEMLTSLDKINSILSILQESKHTNKYWNITWNLGVCLSNLIELNNPKNILEIGTSNGFSTLWMIKGFTDESQKITTIEVDSTRYQEALKNFKGAQVSSYITPLLGEVFEILDEYSFREKFDFVFLDAAHKKYRDVIEILERKNLLSSSCLIVADNIISHSYMDEFVSWMEQKYLCDIIKLDSGFLVARSFS